MKNPLRLYDVLTVMGLLSLLLVLPAHLAQDLEEEPIDAGATFRPRPVHYGDVVTYEIIFQQRGHPTTTTGAVITIRFSEPDAEAPDGAVLQETREVPARHIDLGPALYVSNARTEIRYFDAERSQIGFRAIEHLDATDDETARGANVHEPTQRTWHAPAWHDFGGYGYSVRLEPDPLTYRPASTWESIRALVRDEPVVRTGGQPMMGRAVEIAPEDRLVAPFAATHQGRVLYAKEPVEEWHVISRSSAPGAQYVMADAVLSLGLRQLDLRVRWTEDLVIEGPMQRWTWWARDIPIQAGEHMAYHDRQGEMTHSLDLVVTAFTPGTVPVHWQDPPIMPGRYEPPIPPNEEPPAPSPLLTFNDPRPIIGDVSLRDIGELLRGPDAPASIRTLAEDAALGGLAWHGDANGTDVLVVLVRGGELRAAHVALAPQPIVRDACDGTTLAGHEVKPRCEKQVPPITLRYGERPPDLPAEIARLRAALGTMVDGVAEESGTYDPRLMRERVPHEDNERIFSGFSTWLPMRATEGGVRIAWHEANGTHLMGRGSELPSLFYQHDRTPTSDEGFGAQQPPTIANAAAPVRIIQPIPSEITIGGLLLVALGLLIRFAGVVKSGAHLPLLAFFYAKITRDAALDHARREALHALVAADPGVSLDEAARNVGLSRTATLHHLQTLERNGLLRVTKLGRTRHYFLPAFGDGAARLRRAVQRYEQWESLLRAVEEEPGVPLKSLTARMGRSKHSVSRTGSRLEALGLVKKERVGRELRYHPLNASSAGPAPLDRGGP